MSRRHVVGTLTPVLSAGASCDADRGREFPRGSIA